MRPLTAPRPFYMLGVVIIMLEYVLQCGVCGEAIRHQTVTDSMTDPMTDSARTVAEIVTSLSYTIDTQDDYAIQQLAVIVDALENLNILDGNKQKCYMVDRITKLTEQVDSTTQKIALAFYVSQPIGKEDLNASKAAALEEVSGVNESKPERSCGEGEFITSDKGVTGTGDSINTQNTTSSSNETIAQQGSDQQGVEKHNSQGQDDSRGKLSHTQIMVISTCSTVIGLFFIVALIMRIRNYLKRKSESLGKRRSHLTSSSMAFRSSSHSPARTDSIVSKCGFPDSTSALPVHSSQMNGSYPKTACSLVAPDNKPLLVITSASAPSSPLIHAGLGRMPKSKVTHTPSAPTGSGTSSKDYLTINSIKYHRGTPTSQTSRDVATNNRKHAPLTKTHQHTGIYSNSMLSNHTSPHSNHRDTHSNHKDTHSNHKDTHSNHKDTHNNHRDTHSNHRDTHSNHRDNYSTPSHTKPGSVSLHFNEYFRDSSKDSSESSLSGLDLKTKASKTKSTNQKNNSTGSSESNRTQSESSEAATTDSSSSHQSCDIERKPSDTNNTAAGDSPPHRSTSDEVFEDQPPVSDRNIQLIPSILTTRNDAQESKEDYPHEQQSLGLSPREKRSSSSSSYGRKSVSFSIDIEQRQSLSSDLDDEDSPEDEQRQGENCLLLRPEFLGMEPTYV